MKVVTIFNVDVSKSNALVSKNPSLTVPDQTYTMRQILDRSRRGLPVSGGRVPLYDEDDDLPDIRTMDLCDIQEYKDKLEDIRRREREWQDKSNKKKEKDSFDKIVNDRLNQMLKEKEAKNEKGISEKAS